MLTEITPERRQQLKELAAKWMRMLSTLSKQERVVVFWEIKGKWCYDCGRDDSEDCWCDFPGTPLE